MSVGEHSGKLGQVPGDAFWGGGTVEVQPFSAFSEFLFSCFLAHVGDSYACIYQIYLLIYPFVCCLHLGVQMILNHNTLCFGMCTHNLYYLFPYTTIFSPYTAILTHTTELSHIPSYMVSHKHYFTILHDYTFSITLLHTYKKIMIVSVF